MVVNDQSQRDLIKGKKRRLNKKERERYREKGYSWVVYIPYTYTWAGKTITVPRGFLCNGATMSPDINSDSWIIHDWLYCNHHFDDGELCSRRIADMIMMDILKYEGGAIRYIFRKCFKLAVRIDPFDQFQKAWELGSTVGFDIHDE